MLQACNLLLPRSPIILVVPHGGEGASKVDDLMLKEEAAVLNLQLQRWRVAIRLIAPEDLLSSFLVPGSSRSVSHGCGGVIHESA